MPEKLAPIVETYLERKSNDPTLSISKFVVAYPHFEHELRPLLSALAALDNYEGGKDAFELYRAPKGFEIVGELGRGGMGVVYEALQEPMGRRVALKVMFASRNLDPRWRDRFHREAEVMSRLDHPNLCAVHAAGLENGMPWIAMQLVLGQSLAKLIAAQRSVSEAEAEEESAPLSQNGDKTQYEMWTYVSVIEEAAKAIHYAHEAGVIHRDLKPGNIMINAEGQPVVLDFGLAADATEVDARLTHTGDVLGTPAYMSPEQLRGEVVDARSDVFSLAATLYELLTLRRAFEGATVQALRHSIQHQSPREPGEIAPQINRELSTVILAALEKEPDLRYATAWDFAEDLRRARLSEPLRVRPPTVARRAWKWVCRHPKGALAGLALVVLITALGVVSGILLSRWSAIEAGEVTLADRAHEQTLQQAFLHYQAGGLGPTRYLEKAIDEEPSDLVAVVALAAHLRRVQSPDDFAKFLASLSRTARSAFAVRLFQSQVLHAQGRLPEAESIRAALGQPETAADFFALGVSSLTAGQSEGATDRDKYLRSALKFLEQAVIRSPKAHTLIHLHRARAAILAGARPAMRRIAEEIVVLWPESGYMWHHRGLIYLALASPERSVPATGHGYRVSQLRPSTMSAERYQEAEADMESAVEAFRRATELEPKEPWINVGLPSALIRLQNLRGKPSLEPGATMLKAVLAEDSQVHTAAFELGKLMRQAGRNEEALEQFRSVSRIGDYPAAALMEQGMILFDLERLKEAQSVLEQALQAKNAPAYVHYVLARVLEKQGKVDEAITAIETAIDRAPKEAKFYSRLAGLYFRADRGSEGAATLKRGIRAHPKSPLLFNHLATMYLDSQLAAKALSILQGARKRGVRSPELSRCEAEVLASLGRLGEAVTVAEAAFKLLPAHLRKSPVGAGLRRDIEKYRRQHRGAKKAAQ